MYAPTAKGLLQDYAIDVYDPRAHVAEYIVDGIVNGQKLYPDGKIFAQDLFHLRQTDILLVRLKWISVATLIELGMVYMWKVIAIIAFDVVESLRSHPFIEGTVSAVRIWKRH